MHRLNFVASNGTLLPSDRSVTYAVTESIHNGGHLESYYDCINNEIWDTLSAFDPTWKDESDIKKILQSLSDDDKSKVRAEICNTLTKLKEKLLNGEIVIHKKRWWVYATHH